jgi:hypothetical protein
MTGKLRRSRARDLLARVRKGGSFTDEQLCTELVLDARQLAMYAEGLEAIPLDRQLCLAAFLIERVPALAADGHSLHAQVKAATTFATNERGRGR